MTNHLEINLDTFSKNLQHVKKIVGDNVSIMPVIKADAYGHGAVRLAKTALENGVSILAIGTPEEGIMLRRSRIMSSILALDGITEGYEDELIKNKISSVVSNIQQLEELDNAALRVNKKAKIHIKVDTGMARLGVKPEQVTFFLEEALKKKNIFVEGIMTHFSTSPEKSDFFASMQINIFKSSLKKIYDQGYKVPLIHAANSGAILNYPDSYFNIVRPGIILYGSLPSYNMEYENKFEHVMQFKTKIIHINSIKKGESVGYDRNFIATRDIKSAVIPVGYAVGYNRLLSNKSKVIIKGYKAPQIGNICMDLTMIDVTDVGEVEIGDEVVLIGRQGNQEITIEEIAKNMNTIPYEVMCMIGSNVQKVYIGGD